MPIRISSARRTSRDSALHAGIAYPELLQKLITLGRGYRAEWRED